jgi:hypothetical protein
MLSELRQLRDQIGRAIAALEPLEPVLARMPFPAPAEATVREVAAGASIGRLARPGAAWQERRGRSALGAGRTGWHS